MDTDYAYLHNLQGDVVGILDMDGASVVDYTYDVCRMPNYTESSMAETLGVDNPFRYRGGCVGRGDGAVLPEKGIQVRTGIQDRR